MSMIGPAVLVLVIAYFALVACYSSQVRTPMNQLGVQLGLWAGLVASLLVLAVFLSAASSSQGAEGLAEGGVIVLLVTVPAVVCALFASIIVVLAALLKRTRIPSQKRAWVAFAMALCVAIVLFLTAWKLITT